MMHANSPTKALQSYLHDTQESFTRLDEINAIRRNNINDMTPELNQEKLDIENQLYEAGQSLWEAFKEWSEKECGYKPAKLTQNNPASSNTTPGQGREE